MAGPTKYNISGFIKGSREFGLPFSNRSYSAALGAAADTTLAVPVDSGIGEINSTKMPKYIALFHYEPDAEVYVALNATAAVPAGPAFALTASVLNPEHKLVVGGDTLHFFSTAGANVSVEFFYISEA